MTVFSFGRNFAPCRQEKWKNKNKNERKKGPVRTLQRAFFFFWKNARNALYFKDFEEKNKGPKSTYLDNQPLDIA
jgi:hypothetical protein